MIITTIDILIAVMVSAVLGTTINIFRHFAIYNVDIGQRYVYRVHFCGQMSTYFSNHLYSIEYISNYAYLYLKNIFPALSSEGDMSVIIFDRNHH